MPDRNVTFLILAKDFASRTMRNIGDNTDRAAQKLRNLNTLGLGPLATAGAALGPALLPVLGGAVIGTAALGASFTAAGAAAGVFGAVTADVFTEVQEASKKSSDLRDKISLLNREIALTGPASGKAASLIKSRDKALLEYKARLAELPAPTRNAVLALDSLKSAWQRFVDANKPAVLSLMTRGFAALRDALPGLQPLFEAGAAAAGKLMDVFERFVASGGVEDLSSWLASRAGPAFETFGKALTNFGVGLGNLVAPFLDMTGTVEGGLVNMSKAFRDWANTSGQQAVRDLIAYVIEHGPQMASTFGDLAGAFVAITKAAAPLAPVSMAIASSLSQIVEAIPPDVLTALIGGFIAWSAAMKIGGGIARFGPLVGMLARFLPLLISPVGLVVLGILALGTAFYIAWQKSETFRNMVKGALKAVGDAAVRLGEWFQDAWRVVSGALEGIGRAAQAVGEWFGRSWQTLQQWWTNVVNFFTMLPSRIMGAIAAFPGLLFAYWRRVFLTVAYIVGFGIGAVIGFFQKLPGRIMGAIRSLQTSIPALWSVVWSRAKTIVSSGVSAVVSFFAGLPGRAQRALSSLWGRMAGAFSAARAAAVARAREIVLGAISWLSQLPGRAARAIASVPSRIRGVFAGAGSWLASAGYNLIMGLARGIGNAAGAAVSAARRVAGSIVSGVRAGLGISSPSRVMRDQVGAWIPPGIAAGIMKSAPGLMSTVDRMVADLVRTVQTDSRVGISAGVSGSPLRQSMPSRTAGGGAVVVINVSGALDPHAVGKQVVDLLARWATSQGKTFELAR